VSVVCCQVNGISTVRVPWGTRCSNVWLVFLTHPNNINLIHKGRARVSVSVKCLVLVRMYGNSPKKLFVTIIRNGDVRMNGFPLFSFPFLRIVFISWCNLFIVHSVIGALVCVCECVCSLENEEDLAH
jgi:hypothetical protein